MCFSLKTAEGAVDLSSAAQRQLELSVYSQRFVLLAWSKLKTDRAVCLFVRFFFSYLLLYIFWSFPFSSCSCSSLEAVSDRCSSEVDRRSP